MKKFGKALTSIFLTGIFIFCLYPLTPDAKAYIAPDRILTTEGCIQFKVDMEGGTNGISIKITATNGAKKRCKAGEGSCDASAETKCE